MTEVMGWWRAKIHLSSGTRPKSVTELAGPCGMGGSHLPRWPRAAWTWSPVRVAPCRGQQGELGHAWHLRPFLCNVGLVCLAEMVGTATRQDPPAWRDRCLRVMVRRQDPLKWPGVRQWTAACHPWQWRWGGRGMPGSTWAAGPVSPSLRQRLWRAAASALVSQVRDRAGGPAAYQDLPK